MSRHHEIPATPENMVWGYFDATVPPVLEVDSGDTVTLTSWMAGYQAQLHPDPARAHPLHLRALEEVPAGPGAHFVTGPVFVRGATPGDVLQIDILGAASPRLGLHLHPAVPPARSRTTSMPTRSCTRTSTARVGVMMLPWGKEIALDPFFGVIARRCRRIGGAARRRRRVPSAATWTTRSYGRGRPSICPCSTRGAVHGGRRSWRPGRRRGLHQRAGDRVTGSFRLTVRKDLGYRHPFAENATHLISIGLDEDLDDAARQAVRQMVEHVVARTRLSRGQAYMLCSLAGDLRVTQTVDGVKGCHMTLAKAAL